MMVWSQSRVRGVESAPEVVGWTWAARERCSVWKAPLQFLDGRNRLRREVPWHTWLTASAFNRVATGHAASIKRVAFVFPTVLSHLRIEIGRVEGRTQLPSATVYPGVYIRSRLSHRRPSQVSQSVTIMLLRSPSRAAGKRPQRLERRPGREEPTDTFTATTALLEAKAAEGMRQRRAT